MNGKKISAQVVGGALAAICVWLINVLSPIPVPAEIAVAFGTVFSVVVSLLVPDDLEDGGQTKQGGFARVSLLIALALASSLFLAGCGGNGFLRTAEPIAVPQSLPDVGKEAQKLVNEANILLTASYRVIGDNAANGIWAKAYAQKKQDTADEYGEKIDDVQELIDKRLFTDARAQADIINRLVLELHKEAAAQARKAEKK